jgi:hypothetical protein
LALGLGVAADALVGCSSDAPAPAPSSGPAPLPRAEVPTGVRGVCIVPNAAALFELASKSYDLPLAGRSWPVFATNALGLPITASEAFDSQGPLRAALVEPNGSSPSPIVALPMRAPDRLIAVATLGEGAPFRVQKDEAVRGERLVQNEGSARFELAVVRNALVVGPPGTLAHAADFMADPSQPLFASHGEEVRGFIAGTVLARLLGTVVELFSRPQRQLLQASLPSAALTDAVAAVAEIPFQAAISASVASVRLTLPKTRELSAPLASLTSGELGSLFAADRDASIAFTLSQTEADRVKGAEWLANALPWVGLASEPPSAIRDALVALARARGDGFQVAIERGPAGALAYGSCDLSDEEAGRRALAALTKGAVTPTKDAIVSLRVVDTRLTLIGEAVHLFVDRDEKRLASLLMRIENRRLALATGKDSVVALKKAMRRRAEDGPASLADLGVVKALLPALPPRASLFAFFDPARWLADERPSGDPEHDRSAMALAVQTSPEEAVVTLALEPAAARALARAVQGTL